MKGTAPTRENDIADDDDDNDKISETQQKKAPPEGKAEPGGFRRYNRSLDGDCPNVCDKLTDAASHQAMQTKEKAKEKSQQEGGGRTLRGGALPP